MARYPLNFESDELRAACEKRAAEKGISLNAWINRALAHAVTAGGKVKITTTTSHEV